MLAQKITINTTDQGDGELGNLQIWHEEWGKHITSSNVAQVVEQKQNTKVNSTIKYAIVF